MGIAVMPNSKAVSPLIATVFTILFGVMMLAIVLNVVNPMFRRAQDTSVVTDAFQNLEMLNTAIGGVSSEAQGSKRTVSLSVTGGFYRTNSTYDWLYFEYEPQEDIRLTGTKGNVKIERGLEFADYFNYYADGSKATPAWTNISGQWTASDYKYSGQNGLAYHNVSGPFENWKFSASISNVTGPTGGQVFVLPTNPESLVGFWPFDNRSGSVAYDYSGNRNNGTLTNMNTTGNSTSGWQDSANCKAGRSCLRFDGVDDYVSVPWSSSLNVSDPLSFGVWFYLNSWKDVSNQYFVVALRGTPTWIWTLEGTGTTTQLRFRVGSAGNPGVTTSGLQLNTWYHAVATISSGEGKLYVNGNYIGNFSTGTLPTNTQSYMIGAYTSSSYRFNGTIDEVMVFNRSLTAGEVTALYELSAKKLDVTGTQTITAKTNVSVVLSNPAGRTKFDDVRVTRDRNKLTFIIPYDGIDINGTLRVGKGEHQIEITHMGTNTTSNRAIIQITAV